ncbi:PsiF family protein [Tardiphaga sp. 709]|nr:PsiF family protein [Tardiphaga sp. 709]WNV12568.1 PsiF family protein [Tardiphaga sp. 709]
MRFASSLATAAVASFLLLGAATAQTPAPAATKTAPAKAAPADKMAPADKTAEKPRTAASLECSKQADAKGLHGDARRKFRSECKKTAKPN